MRKYFVTGFYMLIVGGLLLLGGILMGANRSVVWDHGFKVAQNVNETYPLDDFKNVYVEGRDTNVNLKLGDRYKIHVDGDRSQVPTYKVKGDTLTVTGSNRKKRIGVGVFGRPQITITIPMDKKIDNTNIRLANGTIKISDVSIENLVKSAKDLDYDSNMYLNNVTVNNADKINLYNATLGMKNSKITNMSLVAGAYADVTADSTTITNSSFNLDESKLTITKSNLDSVKSLANHSKVNLNTITLMNENSFRIFGSSKFTGKSITTDGLDLATDKGFINYYDKNTGKTYQHGTDMKNLLYVRSNKGPIIIK